MLWLLAGCAALAAPAAVLVSGLPDPGIGAVLRGVWTLQMHPARLLNDFMLAAGPGPAVLNALVVAATGVALIRATGTRLSGPSMAAVFTLFGFGLFGKTIWNVLPIYLGVWLAARVAGKHMGDYILIALFGSALGPLVTLLAVELGLPPLLGVSVAVTGGVLVGMVLPAVAMTMLRLHQGYSLYNMGLTTGFVAMLAAAVTFGGGSEVPIDPLWKMSPDPLSVWMVPVTSGVLILAGLLDRDRPLLAAYRDLLKLPGRLPSDFMEMAGRGASLVNMGIMGLLFWGLVLAVGAPLNGPVLGGIYTVVGFAAFGKHPRNVTPVVAGIAGAALLFGHGLSDPGVILAILFGTTLAPIAGQFGVLLGVVAGALHLLLVLRSGAWHAGIGLYNNGLAGGLTAAFLVSMLDWYRANRPERHAARAGSFAQPAAGAGQPAGSPAGAPKENRP